MVPDETIDQGYTEGGDDEVYYEDDYYPTDAERELELMRQQLAEALSANQELSCRLEESQRNLLGRPKKKSSRRTHADVTETATVQIEDQARTGPVTRQAARAAGETQTQAP